MELYKSGKDLIQCLNEGLSFDRKQAWYSAIRGVDVFIQEGQFAILRERVYELPCLLDPAFQWGLCQRLGEVAANSRWDTKTRQDAMDLLGEIYKDGERWGYHVDIKQWIIIIVTELTSLTKSDVKAAELLRELQTTSDPKTQGIHKQSWGDGLTQSPFTVSLLQLESSSLLDRAQKRTEVEEDLLLLREKRTKEQTKDVHVYIHPYAKASLRASDDAQEPLMETIMKFLSGDQKVFLILGDCGAGKSTFNRALEFELWKKYTEGEPIPLHINLPAIDKPEHDMITKQLRKSGFSEDQIRELKRRNRDFILICDSYDESQQTKNLYTSNQLNEPGGWCAKMVISCRTEYIGVEYHDRFQPGDRNSHANPGDLQEAVITPFSATQIDDYINKYSQLHHEQWTPEEYQNVLNRTPCLNDLVKNPFMLRVTLEVLPRLLDDSNDTKSTRISRVALYDQFIEQWLERGKIRIGGMIKTPQAKTTFESMSDEGFVRNGISFLKRLAIAIYKEQDGNPVVEYLHIRDQDSWKADFFGREEEKQLFREASPLVRNESQHRFVHRSLLEYAFSRAVFDPHERRKKTTTGLVKARRGSSSSVMSFEAQSVSQDIGITEQRPENSALSFRNLVNDQSLLHFLQERVQQERSFEEQLLSIIEHSKTDKNWRIAAANAITILVRAGVQFNRMDWKGIQIPGADLSNGVFDAVSFQEADLRKVNFRKAWLRQSNLNKANMTGVQFGESLAEEWETHFCAYSPDGKSFVVGLDNGDISVYLASNFGKIWTLRGHSERISSISYSQKGDRVVSGSADGTVRLWDIKGKQSRLILSEHEGEVTSVAYSPKGDQVVSAGKDMTIRIWNAETGLPHRVLKGHNGGVTSMQFFKWRSHCILQRGQHCTTLGCGGWILHSNNKRS